MTQEQRRKIRELLTEAQRNQSYIDACITTTTGEEREEWKELLTLNGKYIRDLISMYHKHSKVTIERVRVQ